MLRLELIFLYSASGGGCFDGSLFSVTHPIKKIPARGAIQGRLSGDFVPRAARQTELEQKSGGGLTSSRYNFMSLSRALRANAHVALACGRREDTLVASNAVDLALPSSAFVHVRLRRNIGLKLVGKGGPASLLDDHAGMRGIGQQADAMAIDGFTKTEFRGHTKMDLTVPLPYLSYL